MTGFILGAPFWLAIGWFFFPAPGFVQALWVKYGWAKPTPPAPPATP